MSTFSICLEMSESRSAQGSRIQDFWIKKLFLALMREIEIRRALRQVHALDDAALNDIGVSRGGIDNAVRRGRF